MARNRNAIEACRILDAQNPIFLDFPDNRMDKLDLLSIVQILETLIDKIRPSVIYTHHVGDLNIDHRLVYESCLTACRPIKNNNPKLIAFGVISSMEWNFPNSFNPNYFVNISKNIKAKIRAMQCYKNEIKKFPHPRSIEGIEITAKKWGSVCGTNYAEAFEIIRIVDE